METATTTTLLRRYYGAGLNRAYGTCFLDYPLFPQHFVLGYSQVVPDGTRAIARIISGISVNWIGVSRLLVAMFLVSGMAGVAHAHQFSIAQGTATVHADRVAIVLEFNGEDLRHVDGSPPPSDAGGLSTWIDNASQQHGQVVCDRLIVRDIDGNSISGRVLETKVRKTGGDSTDVDRLRDVRVVHSLSYPLRERASLLTFQQSTDSATSLRTQWIMAVRVDGEERERIVRLTSQGNAETLAFDSCDKLTVDVPPPMRDEKFRSMYVIVRHQEHGMTLDLFAPLTIVETFVPTSRRNPDYVEMDEQTSILAAWEKLVASRVDVIRGEEPMRGAVTASEFAPPCPSDSDSDSSTRRVSAYSARVHAQFEFADAPSTAELTWKLFNNLVLNVPLFIEQETVPIVAELTTYAPRIALTLPAKPTTEPRER